MKAANTDNDVEKILQEGDSKGSERIPVPAARARSSPIAVMRKGGIAETSGLLKQDEAFCSNYKKKRG